MIVTDRFVMLNFPKTGSTFAREMINILYEKKYGIFPYSILKRFRYPRYFDLTLPALDKSVDRNDQHGRYCQIPKKHRHKEIISITRNPFSRYVSLYLFRWWENHLYAPREQLKSIWPHFPDLSFAEFYDMLHKFGTRNSLGDLVPKLDIGSHSTQFIQFYFLNPEETLRNIDEEYILKQKYLSDKANITFIHQENLHIELYDVLIKLGYREKMLRHIKNAAKINVTEKTHFQKKVSNFYTPEIIRKIEKRDKLIFNLFPEYKEFGE